MRLCFLRLLLFISQAVAVIGADDQTVLSAGSDDGSHGRVETADAGGSSLEQAGSGGPAVPGAGLVDAALEELRKIPAPSSRRRQRVPGLIGTVFRLGLRALPSFQPEPAGGGNGGGPLAEPVRLLEQAALQNNSDALYLLAEMNFHGNYSHPRDLGAAFRHYHRLAAEHGNSTAQFMLGVLYGTGLGGVVPRDQARALLYHTLAAQRGDTRAQMAVGFRHHSGIGTPSSCERACGHYKQVADKTMAWYRSGPPLGMAWVQEASRIADDGGGVYGEGASASSAGLNALKASIHSDAHAAIDDVIEYLDLMSQKGDSRASYNLGRIYYEGQRDLGRDPAQARRYFFTVAWRYWRRDGRVVDGAPARPGLEKTARLVAGFLGRMYLRGDGMEQNFEHARVWFERGVALGDAQSQHGLAVMLLRGYGGPRGSRGGGARNSEDRAVKLLRAAADQDYAPAQVELGVLYLDQGDADDVRTANNFFELAARWGNLEALYYLAELTHKGIGRDRNCNLALGYYKSVAEKADPLHSTWAEANRAYREGDRETALVEYLLAAEQGYERAQNNVALMLDRPAPSRRLPRLAAALSSFVLGRDEGPRSGSGSGSGRDLLDDPSLALIYWTRSSRQNNVDSTVKMGDYYYYGIGADPDIGRAVQCYTGASDYSQSAQALFNLGWMHENGIGLTQDFHLAKRFYDQALEVNEEAYLPVSLSLLKLRVRSAWNTFTRGPVHSIQDDPKPKKDWSLGEWISNFLEDDEDEDEQLLYEDAGYEDRFDDAHRGGGGGGGADEEDLPPPRGDNGVNESLAIVMVASVLAVLLFYRQQRQLARRQREEEEARRGAGEGIAEPEGEPDMVAILER